MGFRDQLRNRILEWAMRQMNELREEALAPATGDVLEVGFGTGLNLDYYPEQVGSVVGVDPNLAQDFAALEKRASRVTFPLERRTLSADHELPFDSGRFDCVVTTWTLCSIPDPGAALAEMRRVLKPGGHYLFIEHGRAASERTARWQERLNPAWKRIAGGCNMNRPIDRLIEDARFEIQGLNRFLHTGPAVLSQMYRGVASPV